MPFDPNPNDMLTINEKQYQVLEHPSVLGQAYVQEGRKSWIYKLQARDSQKSYALKVFKPAFRNPHIAHNSESLRKYIGFSGMQVCQRFVVTLDSDSNLLTKWPDLEYAVLMPWIDGILWLVIVMQRITLSWATSLSIALKSAEILSKIEENGNAHCDIVGDNVIVDLASQNVEFLDVEDMFGTGFSKPSYIPVGGAGYQHRQSGLGQWCADGDRFATSMLLAEMLTWHKPEIRDAVFGEQYFDPREMQGARSERYRLIVQSLNSISSKLAELFERAWYSASFNDCPRVSEWADELRQVRADSEKSMMAPSQPSTLLDFSQATQSSLEQDWEPYGSRDYTVDYHLNIDRQLGQVLTKSGRGFHAALRHPPSDAPSLRWPPYQYYELVVKSSDMDLALHINVAIVGGEDRTLLYGPAQRYGQNPEVPEKEFQIPLDERGCDGTWHSVIVDLMGDVKRAGWSEFWKVRWLALHGEMRLYRVRGSNDLPTLEESAIAPVYSTQRQLVIPQRPPSAERPAPAISVSPVIRQLATLIRTRRKAGDRSYTLLLGSSLSLTPEVRQAVCGSDDWEAFWRAMQRLSPTERRALLADPLDGLNLTAGYRCLAQLVQAGYFDLVLTLNVDDALDESLRILSAREYQIFTHGQVPGTEIAAALGRTYPRVKAVKLRGDINAYKLPLTPEGQFEFPKELEEAVERLLSQDTILVGDISSDTDIQRCIRQGEGALWVVVPEELRSGSFLYNAKQARSIGEIITGPEAEFVSFFSALARELGEVGRPA